MTKIAVGLFGVIAASMKLFEVQIGRRARITALKNYVEILDKLPEDSQARPNLLAYVDADLQRELAVVKTRRRSPGEIVSAILMLATGAWLGYVAVAQTSAWWGLVAVALLVAGGSSLVTGLLKVERDLAGQPSIADSVTALTSFPGEDRRAGDKVDRG